jgi:hypothetical protein
MLECQWDVRTVDGPAPATDEAPASDTVTLVAAVVDNETPVTRAVRLHSTLAGPALPPRRRGVPEAGWTDDGFEGVVPPAGRLALGFAAGGPPADPPVEVIDRGRADGADSAGETTPTAVVRELGSPAPPREAVPSAAPAGSDDGRQAPGAGARQREQRQNEDRAGEDAVPTHVSAWLDAVGDRVDRGATEHGDHAALRRVAERVATLAEACPPGGAAEP